MAVDITNHLIPYTQVKRMLADAWDEAIDEARERLMMMGCDEDELKAANPYRGK